MRKFVVLISLTVLLAACNSSQLDTTLSTQDFELTGFVSDMSAPKIGMGTVMVGSSFNVNFPTIAGYITHYGNNYWTKNYDSPEHDDFFDVVVTNDDISYVLVARQDLDSPSTSVYLRRYNSNGSVQWMRKVGPLGASKAIRVALDNNNNVYTLTQENDVSGYVLRKWDANGTVLISIRNSNIYINQTSGLAIDSSSNMYVSTSFWNSSGRYARIYKYNSAGVLILGKIVFQGSADVEAGEIVIDSLGNLYTLVSQPGVSEPAVKYWLKKLNGNLDTLWSKAIDFYSPYELTVDQTNRIYVAGGISVAKYSTNGVQLWKKDISISYENYPASAYISGLAVSDVVYIGGSYDFDPKYGPPGKTSYYIFSAKLNPSTGTILSMDK